MFGPYLHNFWTIFQHLDNIKLILPHSAPSWILSKAENLASSSLQDGATKWYYFLEEPPTHPPYGFFFLNILHPSP